MTITKYYQVSKVAGAFASETEVGVRKQMKLTEKMVMEWVKNKCGKRTKNSVYCVHITNTNLGTRKWYDACPTVMVDNITEWKETDKSFVSKHGTRISKDKIIGWLTK